MSFKCNLGFHSWNGCKCKACDKTRDESHDWAADCEKCAKCGKTRSVGHSWSGCKCTMCGKTRDEVNVENSERVSSIQDPSPLTSSPTQRMREATCSHKWNKSGVQCSLCERKRNLTGMTVVAAAYSLVAPLDTASELNRSFL
jgi:hypothetical protein